MAVKVIHYLVESPTSRTKTQPFVAMDGPSLATLGASDRLASGHLVNHATSAGLDGLIALRTRSDIGWACFEWIQTISFNSFIISANKMVRFQNLYCANSFDGLSVVADVAMEICLDFHFHRRY